MTPRCGWISTATTDFGKCSICARTACRRPQDSLLALWRADPQHILWPELAALHWNLLRSSSGSRRCSRAPGFPDSSTALGAFLRDWKKLKYGTMGAGFRRAWAAREELTPWQRVWLTLRMSRLERRQGRAEEATRLALEALPAARELGGWRLEMEAWLQLMRALRLGDHLDDALHAAAMAEELSRAVSRQTGNVYIVQNVRLERAEVLAARREVEPALLLYEACADSALAHGLASFAGQCLNWAGIADGGDGRLRIGARTLPAEPGARHGRPRLAEHSAPPDEHRPTPSPPGESGLLPRLSAGSASAGSRPIPTPATGRASR